MMGPEIEMDEKSEAVMDVSSVSVKETSNTNVKLPEEELVVCASNCEDHCFVDTVSKSSEEHNLTTACASNCEDTGSHMEVDCHQDMVSKGRNEDVEVEIVDNVVSDEETIVERESLNATESSTSFGCTDSEAATDAEVESQVRNDSGALIEFDGFNDLFVTRKKKVTPHWRKFTRPVTWRCKWAELHIRELCSQASKYDRKLAECSRRKQRELDKCTGGKLDVKSTPSVYQNESRKIMKRKKRKRVEETVDLASYSSCHTLFSYFASKRACGGSTYLDDEHGNIEKASGRFGVNGEWSYLEFKDSDAFEDILRNIEVAQLHVRQLKTRIDTVVRETAEHIPVNSSLAPCEPLACCGPSISNGNCDKNFQMRSIPTTSQKVVVLPDSGVSDYREVKPLPDMIGATDRPEKCDRTENVVMNQSVKEELKTEPVDLGTVPNSSKMCVSRDRQSVKILSKLNTMSKSKKKRGQRKARASRWSKRSSG